MASVVVHVRASMPATEGFAYMADPLLGPMYDRIGGRAASGPVETRAGERVAAFAA